MPPATGPGPTQSEADASRMEREEIILDNIESLFELAISTSEHKQEIQLITKTAVSQCIHTCLNVVDMVFPARQDYAVESIAIEHKSWEPGPEPEPCSIDTWVRGVLPEVEKKPVVFEDDTRGKSIIQTRRSLVDPSSLPGPQIANAARKASTMPSKSLSTSPVSKPRKVLTQEQKLAEERLREELEARKAQQKVVLQMQQKDEEARVRLESLQKDLRGKEYGYNHRGEVVVLNRLDPERMPILPSPAMRLATPPSQNQHSVENGGSAAQQHRTDAGTSRNKIKPMKASEQKKTYSDSEYVERPSRSQPNALETMKIAGGVTIRQGNKMRKGPAVQGPPPSIRSSVAGYENQKSMSRQELASYARSVGRRETDSSTAVGGNSRRATLDTPGTEPPQTPTLGLKESLLVGASQPITPAGKLKAPAVMRPASPDVNIALTRSPDWGAGTSGNYSPPPALPVAKPSTRDKGKEVGAGKLPRARVAYPVVAAALKSPTTPQDLL